jgi:hypothetical protein
LVKNGPLLFSGYCYFEIDLKMVRIIRDKETTRASEPVLSDRSKILLQMLSIVLAEKPRSIQNLLTDYQIELSDEPTDKERTEKLLSAIAICDHRFNTDLAMIILDCTENEYDNFDIKGLFNKSGESGNEESSNSSGGNGGGLIGGIANAVGGIGGAIGQAIKGRQAKEQATSQTLQGIYNYRAQLASNEKSKSKNKVVVLISVFVLVALVVGAVAYYQKNQVKQQLPNA